MRAVSAILAGLALALAPQAFGQPGLTLIASHRLESDLRLRDLQLVDRMLYGVDDSLRTPDNDLLGRLIRIDPVSGDVVVLSDVEAGGFGSLMAFTADRILARSQNLGFRFELYSRRPVEQLTTINLKHRVLDAIEVDGELHLLQSGYEDGLVVERFNRQDFSYLGRIPLAQAQHVRSGIFHHGGITGLGREHDCTEGKTCYSVSRWDMKGSVLSTYRFETVEHVRVPGEPYRYCGEDGFVAKGDGMTVVRANCAAFAMNGYARKFLFSIDPPLPGHAIAISGEFVFSATTLPAKPGGVPTPVLNVIDRRTGKRVRSIESPPALILADRDRLIRVRYEDRSTIDIFRIDAAAMRDTSRQ